jgi:putative PIN family toxin of toxin-antitoxin system
MKANKTPIVIDSNVWISGVLLKTGTPALLIHQVLKRCQPVFTQNTFAELEERLWRPKFDRYINLEKRKLLLHDIKAIGFWVDIPTHIASQTFSRDTDDDKFIHTALASQTPYLVTGDKDLLVLAENLLALQVQIMTPAQAVQLSEFQA